MKIGNRIFDTKNRCYVMGILNMTPDSFSDGGKYNRPDQALFRVEEMIKEGADIIDVGGESTRPGYTQISDQEEIERTVPVIEKMKLRFDIPVSLDTYKPAVAKAGIQAGADLLNDIWGLKYARRIADEAAPDKTMAEVIADAGVCCCLMHNRKEAVRRPSGEGVIGDILADLKESLSLAKQAGIAEDKIILDPGIGFGKTYEQNLEVMARLDRLLCLGYPLLLGCSRKSVIGLALGLPIEERKEGTLAADVVGIIKGCSFIRVHDVKENVRALKMVEALRVYL